MRVALIIDSLGVGGAERSMQEMLAPMMELGVEPHVVVFHDRRLGVKDLVGCPVHVVPEGRRRLRRIRGVRRILKQIQPDLVHTTLFEADVFGRLSTLGLKVPVVTSLVNMPYEAARLEADRKVTAGKVAAARTIEALTGHLTVTRYHAITRAVRDSYVQHFGIDPHEVDVVYRGRNEQRLGRRSEERKQAVRASLGVPADRRVVLTAGRQEFQKGQIHLVRAFSRSATPNMELWLAGREGHASEEIFREVDASPARERIRLLGHRDDLPELMNGADLFVLPSLWEGLGGVVLEAMALELPIIASSIPPIREVSQDGACMQLVEPADEDALTAALASYDPDAGAELARAARARFEAAFTLESVTRGMVDCFERARQEHQGR